MSIAEKTAVEMIINNTHRKMVGNKDDNEVANLESFLDGLETALNAIGYQVVPSPAGYWYTVIESSRH